MFTLWFFIEFENPWGTRQARQALHIEYVRVIGAEIFAEHASGVSQIDT
jgi:hypothetical protein